VPRRRLLTESSRTSLLALPTDTDTLIRHYTLGERDLAVVRQHRGDHNRLGFAVQLCTLRYPGTSLGTDTIIPDRLLSFVAGQLRLDPAVWLLYAQRPETRREHLRELQTYLGLTPFGTRHFRHFVYSLTDLAQQTDRGLVLATTLVEALRQQKVIVPGVEVVERVCAEAFVRGTRKVYEALTRPLSAAQRQRLDGLLSPREKSTASLLAWLRQPPGVPNAKHVLAHIERLAAVREVGLPDALERSVHQNRLLKLAREGSQIRASTCATWKRLAGTRRWRPLSSRPAPRSLTRQLI
jgi:Domain of unknown function (DUF4158)